MVFLSALDFSLPLKNPVIIFSLVLFIILFAPILLNKLRIPHIIALILAGVIVAPYGVVLLFSVTSIVVFGTEVLVYIMCTEGVEIVIERLKKCRLKCLVLRLLTFFYLISLGTVAASYFLAFSWPAALFLSSM